MHHLTDPHRRTGNAERTTHINLLAEHSECERDPVGVQEVLGLQGAERGRAQHEQHAAEEGVDKDSELQEGVVLADYKVAQVIWLRCGGRYEGGVCGVW